MSELVGYLLGAAHAVELSLRPERSPQLLKDCLERGYIHVRFTGTSGGTELGIALDSRIAQLALTDLEGGSNTIRIAGNLWLDYVHVRCVADINPHTYAGTGHLELLQ